MDDRGGGTWRTVAACLRASACLPGCLTCLSACLPVYLAACLPACWRTRLCQSALRCRPGGGRPSGRSDQPWNRVCLCLSLTFSPLLSSSFQLSSRRSPLSHPPLPFLPPLFFYAPGGSPARVPLVPPRTRPDVRSRQQEGPQVLRHRDVAPHRRRGHRHVLLQVSLWRLCPPNVTTPASFPFAYVPDDDVDAP